MREDTWIKLGLWADIPEETLVAGSFEDRDWLLIKQGEQCAVFWDRCSHQDVKLSDFGEYQSQHLICHAHGAVFRCQDGEPLCYPAKKGLSTQAWQRRGDELWIRVDLIPISR